MVTRTFVISMTMATGIMIVACSDKLTENRFFLDNQPLPVYQWPMENQDLTSVFGESRRNHFHSGIDLSSYLGQVHPVAKGTIIFNHQKNFNPFEHNLGMGNWIAIEHHRGFVSSYIHLSDSLLKSRQNFPNRVNESDVIGHAANTGRSFGAHLHLSILHPMLSMVYNPLLFLPPLADHSSPRILHLEFKHNGEIIKIVDNSSISGAKTGSLSVKIIDSPGEATSHRRTGIYRLDAFLNERMLVSYVFDVLALEKNRILVNQTGFEDIFANNTDYLLTRDPLSSGWYIIIIVAEDFYGNSGQKKFRFQVR